MRDKPFTPVTAPVQVQAILKLVRHNRTPETLLDFPSPADLAEMLGDPAVLAQAAAWGTEAGLQAYAVIDPSSTSLAFEALSGPEKAEYERCALQWACGRSRQLNLADPLETSCGSGDSPRQRLLGSFGFTLLDEASLVYERSLTDPFPEPALPPGWTIRPLAGEAELGEIVALHQAVNASSQMTPSYRLAMMRAPSYLPEGDLAAVDADKRLAGYCTCWYSAEENRLTGRLVGFTDPVGVRPDCRRLGVGRSLLYAGFQLLKEKGMAIARLSTSSTNLAARRVFVSAGYRLVSTRLRYARQA